MSINKARITWAATSLGAAFSAYEIWRNDTGTYVQIADLTPESSVAFNDFEGLRNVAAQYKMRVRRTDGSVSAFTTPTSGITPLLPSGRILLVTNELASSNYLEVNDLRPRQYTFPERAQTHEMYGRTGAVTFKATETEGDAFVLKLLLYAQGGTDGLVTTPPTAGRQAFEKLRALTRATCSYVCVLDSDGNRWYASISLGPQRSDAGSRMTRGYVERYEPGQIYTAELSVREATRTPSKPTTSPT